MEKPKTKKGNRNSVYGFSDLLGTNWIVVPMVKIKKAINFKVSAYSYAKYNGFKVSVRELADGSGYLVEKV
jgi:hypothetical protein